MTLNYEPHRMAAQQMQPPMVSYAQNFEDVLLRRLLHEVKSGRYVDVGAQDPLEDSVTKWFYDCGWSGINIDPHPDYFAKLVRERPRDINLRLAVSDVEGSAEFCFVRNSGLSSLDLGAAAIAATHGLKSELGTVEVKTLNSILAQHAMPEIHFLKIDVEGLEAQVLAGLDLAVYRPWVVLVEATEPVSTVTTWHRFESHLTGWGYQFVHFDGLNTWYLRDESIELAERLRLPPNVFDAFVKWREHAWNMSPASKATQTHAVPPSGSFSTLFSH
jgi:FkbM family methyltransferase